MRFLLIILVVLAGIWLWRASRRADSQLKPQKPPAKSAPMEPLAMVRCTLCAVHIPAVDAVQGKKGPYCCADHLHRAEP